MHVFVDFKTNIFKFMCSCFGDFRVNNILLFFYFFAEISFGAFSPWAFSMELVVIPCVMV